jgi:hypothetical protein
MEAVVASGRPGLPFDQSLPVDRPVIIDLSYLLLCSYYLILRNQLMLIVGYVKYHQPRLKSP